MPIDVHDIGCDYYATSLHKWLNAPLGTGALYVRRDRLSALWPLYGVNRAADDIRKFEMIGTRDGSAVAAIGPALDLYERIGPERKLARLRYLLETLTSLLDDVDGVTVANLETAPYAYGAGKRGVYVSAPGPDARSVGDRRRCTPRPSPRWGCSRWRLRS